MLALPASEPFSTYKRATFYLRPEQIRAVKLFAVTTERPISEVVRDAIEQYLQPYAELLAERQRRWPVAIADDRQLSMFVSDRNV